MTRDECLARDAADPFKKMRERFHLPKGKIYLDGNSLGPMPKAARAHVAHAVEQEWAQDLITSWNRHGWFTLPQTIAAKLAPLLSCGAQDLIVADTISVNLFKLLTAALALRRNRKVILTDSGNFPSDLYVVQGLNAFLDKGHDLRIVAPEAIEAAINTDVAILLLTEVDYRTSRRHNMKALIAKAHAAGALVIWDLSHSAGAIPVDLLRDDADFAVGCTYKYLNGGPGAPAFVFVHPRYQSSAEPALVGWWGHKNPFAFDLDWKPADGLARFQVGTQAILSLAALNAAMDVWADVNMHALTAKGQALCQLFIDEVEQRCGQFGLKLAGPRNMAERGSHVSFSCPEGYAVMQALIARGVIGDFRAPDLIRFGFAPLYNTYVETFDAAATLAEILESRAWDTPSFRTRNSVT